MHPLWPRWDFRPVRVLAPSNGLLRLLKRAYRPTSCSSPVTATLDPSLWPRRATVGPNGRLIVGPVAAKVRGFIRRHVRVSQPAAETTALMVGAALVVFLVLLVLRQNLWTWVERASWVIALVLFPAAIYQLVVLQREQRRLADELTKQPDVRIGVRAKVPLSEPVIELQFKVPVHWQANADMSDVVKLPLSAANVGQRTAYNVLINLVFPKQVQLVPGQFGAHQVRDESEYGRWRLMITEVPTLHLAVTVDFPIAVRIPVEFVQVFPITASVSSDDRPYIQSLLFAGDESSKEDAPTTT